MLTGCLPSGGSVDRRLHQESGMLQPLPCSGQTQAPPQIPRIATEPNFW